MENNQSVQQQSETKPAVEPEKSKLNKGGGNLLIHLLANRPSLLVIGLLGIFFGSAALAVYSLGYVGRVEKTQIEKELEAVAQLEQPTIAPAPVETTNPIPLWMVGAIALSCASGCLIILRLVNANKHRSVRKAYHVPLVRYQSQTEPSPSKDLPVFVPPLPHKPVAAPSSNKAKPIVTVLPPEQNLSLDEDSLANMLDIRKQTPLSTILRK
ncbi:hypothetical protein [Iningainema tapete]|uniref:Transmembrane protein n=1 Tax=Iningainema tapete BLCC-T55 TaxID=2748662 RepID=A0A8J6XAF8_9CYAN|nr:hypothetical protein [Iningainema tapete]MBD2770754.1 hypothetical protein [Iningainema tapete BLCC-T55]